LGGVASSGLAFAVVALVLGLKTVIRLCGLRDYYSHTVRHRPEYFSWVPAGERPVPFSLRHRGAQGAATVLWAAAGRYVPTSLPGLKSEIWGARPYPRRGRGGGGVMQCQVRRRGLAADGAERNQGGSLPGLGKEMEKGATQGLRSECGWEWAIWFRAGSTFPWPSRSE